MFDRMSARAASRRIDHSRFLKMAIRTAGLGIVATMLTSCGNSLSGSSTCQEFMSAPADQQDQVINSLATKYQKPDFTSPLGKPEVPYYCSTHPDTTLDQFFAAASG